MSFTAFCYIHACGACMAAPRASVGASRPLILMIMRPAGCAVSRSGVAVEAVLDAALGNLGEFAISVRELGRYAQNLGKDGRVFQMKAADIVGLAR
jgi:hypothetical protein